MRRERKAAREAEERENVQKEKQTRAVESLQKAQELLDSEVPVFQEIPSEILRDLGEKAKTDRRLAEILELEK